MDQNATARKRRRNILGNGGDVVYRNIVHAATYTPFEYIGGEDTDRGMTIQRESLQPPMGAPIGGCQ